VPPIGVSAGAITRSSWVASWVGPLAAPVWVVGPERRIHYLNDRAAKLLETSPSRCLGLPCYRLVDGRDASGRPYCGPWCPVAAAASRGREIDPVPLHLVSPERGDWWVRILTVPVKAPDGSFPWLIHCAVEWSMPPPVETYLSKVASRSRPGGERRARLASLSRREREILRLLCEDETLHGIAARLHVSYATVRNHVQHLQTKLGVHSILEAVAYRLLETARLRR